MSHVPQKRVFKIVIVVIAKEGLVDWALPANRSFGIRAHHVKMQFSNLNFGHDLFDLKLEVACTQQ